MHGSLTVTLFSVTKAEIGVEGLQRSHINGLGSSRAGCKDLSLALRLPSFAPTFPRLRKIIWQLVRVPFGPPTSLLT
jgi:hypothetical protein